VGELFDQHEFTSAEMVSEPKELVTTSKETVLAETTVAVKDAIEFFDNAVLRHAFDGLSVAPVWVNGTFGQSMRFFDKGQSQPLLVALIVIVLSA
jgi:hypothetical protein